MGNRDGEIIANLAVAAVLGLLGTVVMTKQSLKLLGKNIELEKKIKVMDTALDIYEIANESLSRELDEKEKTE